ncbi:hypothetical protein BGX34_000160 [Mortierella sp. NVP85]|nr:hypothetical protein BGX34_000160 [Mortierella sp. NVP85]
MHALNSHHGSNSHLPAFYQHQQRTPTSSVYGGQSERYQDKEGSVIGLTGRPSPLLKNQSNYRPVLDMTAAEEEENAEILQKITRSNGSRPSSKSKTKRRPRDTSADTDDEEEGQERGEMRRREARRCWCCSRRMCVYMTSLFLFLLAVVLYFVVPRSPGFSFVSVTSMGDPVVTRNQIQEPFSIQLRVDSEENYVPLRLDSIEMTVWLKFDHTKIASNEGLSSSFDIKPRVVQQISVPMMLDYKTYKIDTNADPTLQELISACKPAQGGVVRGIHLTIGGKMRFRGLSWIWKPEFGINVENVPCPVNAKDPTTSSPPPPSMEPAPAPATPSPSSASTPGNENASSRPSHTGGTIPTGSPVATGPRPT